MSQRDNKGAKQLRELFPDRGDRERLAALLGYDPSVVGRWRAGERKPDPPGRAVAQDKLGIDWRDWDVELEEAG